MSTNKLFTIGCLAFASALPFHARSQSPATPATSAAPQSQLAAPPGLPVQAAIAPAPPVASPVAPAVVAPTPTPTAPSAAPPTTAAKSAPRATTPQTRELVTIQDLADAQRKALQEKERELRNKGQSVTPGGTAAGTVSSVTQARPKLASTPRKTRALHGIYTNAQGEFIAEIVHNGVLKQVRDGQQIDGAVIEINGVQQITVKGLGDASCKPKAACPSRSLTLRVGATF